MPQALHGPARKEDQTSKERNPEKPFLPTDLELRHVLKGHQSSPRLARPPLVCSGRSRPARHIVFAGLAIRAAAHQVSEHFLHMAVQTLAVGEPAGTEAAPRTTTFHDDR